jgi:hypothetical protein
VSIEDGVLQADQFFRSRVAKTQDYEKRHKHAPEDSDADEDHDDTVRENAAHKNVFHRP